MKQKVHSVQEGNFYLTSGSAKDDNTIRLELSRDDSAHADDIIALSQIRRSGGQRSV